ncbi:MAG: hypothetical protein H6707_06650 [Deltaproteobacteria bacterium]|nr:hypothetical protein [Deltaproteobacteria bacterium]
MNLSFVHPEEVFRSIEPQRLQRLEAFVDKWLEQIPLQDEARALGLSHRQLLNDVCDQTRFAEQAVDVFAPFEGHWAGGDLHDASRCYFHVWYPTEVSANFAGQRVAMVDSAGRPTLAYDFCQLGKTPRISGLVGARAHRGYALDQEALLWIAEERDNQFSVHLERVWAKGQLYDIRGIVVALTEDSVRVTARSDWRYHRLTDGAVDSLLQKLSNR